MTSNAFHRVLDDYAIEISFSADRDILTGRMQTLARHTDKAFELLRLCVNEARLDDEPFERVKSQIAAGLKREANDPDYAGEPRLSHARLSRSSLWRARARRTRERSTISRKPISRRCAPPLFSRDGLKIAAVGAIDAATLASHLDDVFGALPANGTLVRVPEVTVAGLGTLHVVDLDIPQSTIRFGRQGIARKDPDFVAATVVNHVLGGGVFSARLFREVREKRGLAYSVYSQLVTFDHGAMLSGGTSTKNERAAEVDGGHRSTRSAASPRQGPTEEELDKAKKYLIGSYALRFDTSTKIAGQLVHLQTDGYGVDYLDERNELIAAVTMEDAQARGQAPVRRGRAAGRRGGTAGGDEVGRRVAPSPHPEERTKFASRRVGAFMERCNSLRSSCFETAAAQPPQHEGA